MNDVTLYMMLPDEGCLPEIQPVRSSVAEGVCCDGCRKKKLYLVPDPLKSPSAPSEATKALLGGYCVTPLGDSSLWPSELIYGN